MLRSWKIGRAFGIPLYLHPTFLLLPLLVALATIGQGLFGYLFRLVLVVTVFGCVMLHELGHALMARRYGVRTRDITLYPIGGIARLERLSRNPDEELLIAVAGPAVNVAILLLLTPVLILAAWLGVWPVLQPDGTQSLAVLAVSFVVWVFIVNLGLVLFNMLPAFPMDGGRVLRAFLTYFLGSLRATEIAANLGLGMAVLFGVLALLSSPPNPMLLIVAVFVALAGRQELAAVRRREAALVEHGTEEALSGDNRALHPPFAEPRRNPISRDEEIETVVLRSHLDGAPARAEAPPARGGFTGLIWDRDAQVWVRWQDGRPITVYDGNA